MSEQADAQEALGDLGRDELAMLGELAQAYRRLRDELAKVIVGQDEVLDQLLVAMLSRGHVLLEGVPGLAKTLMVSTLARCFGLSFSRIQFTPDLMPSDITGTEVIQEDKLSGRRELRFLPGPVFANVVLADEINRTPPKTQAALLEAMQERQVTVGGQTNRLPEPFFVLATQNPIEQEGTYPLPEAQQDRFMFKVFVRYPSYEQEYRIATMTTGQAMAEVSSVLSGAELMALQGLVRRVPVPEHVVHYVLRLVRATRAGQEGTAEFAGRWLAWGAGPRAVQFLLLGAKARAALAGRPFVTSQDVQAVAHPVLRHRLILNFQAESEGVRADDVIGRLLETISDRQVGGPVSEDVAQALGG